MITMVALLNAERIFPKYISKSRPKFPSCYSSLRRYILDMDMDFSGQPRIVADYTFKIWASDSDFCNGIIDECSPAELTLTIDNSNSAPFISISSPKGIR